LSHERPTGKTCPNVLGLILQALGLILIGKTYQGPNCGLREIKSRKSLFFKKFLKEYFSRNQRLWGFRIHWAVRNLTSPADILYRITGIKNPQRYSKYPSKFLGTSMSDRRPITCRDIRRARRSTDELNCAVLIRYSAGLCTLRRGSGDNPLRLISNISVNVGEDGQADLVPRRGQSDAGKGFTIVRCLSCTRWFVYTVRRYPPGIT